MTYSMTGYGKGEFKVGSTVINVEIRSVNSRFCEILIKMPVKFTIQEEMLKNFIKDNLKRGKIDVLIEISGKEDFESVIDVNEEKLYGYLNAVKKIKEKFKIDGEINIQNILEIPDIFVTREEKDIVEKFWEGVNRATSKAIKNLNKSRREEGKDLEKDLKERINTIIKNLEYIERTAEKKNKQIFKRLKEKINTLVEGVEKIDKERLELEVAFLSEKHDITEECVRLNHHNNFFLQTLKDGGEIGKKLEFILQEMSREINTIGAKGNLFEISEFVIYIKEEIEKLREQVRNIL